MIGAVHGVLLETADAQYILAAFDALLRDRRPSAQLAHFVDRFRKTVAATGVSGQNADVNARKLGTQADSTEYRPYDVLTSGQAANILGISANGIRDLARRGTVPAYRAGGRWLYPAAPIVARAERRAANRS
ncbi:helix-turn-helix domain-containing protein [Mycolicibacterium sp. HS_4_1]